MNNRLAISILIWVFGFASCLVVYAFIMKKLVIDEFFKILNETSQQIPELVGKQSSMQDEPLVILPVLAVFSCNRPDIQRTLDSLLKYRQDAKQFPVIVSEDCADSATAKAILSYSSQLTYIQHPDLSVPIVPPGETTSYFEIARHYHWSLKQVFQTFSTQLSLLLKIADDLDVAPDFFSYFSSTYQLLINDPTLWCVSAWNDNGKANLVDEKEGSALLYRTDFFPGLGWMMTKTLWNELEPKWPKSYWDDWMRKPEQRKDRACIRPEISRTIKFERVGVVDGLIVDERPILKLNEIPVDFSKLSMNHLMQSNYHVDFIRQVHSFPEVSAFDVTSNTNLPFGPVRITYHSKETFKSTASLFGLMDDFKSGVP